MRKHPLGLYIWFRCAMPLQKRLRAIKDAGFEAISLWWDVRRDMGRDRLFGLPEQAREAGLLVENAHWPFAKCNELWSEQRQVREAALDRHLRWLDECAAHGIPLAVMHLCSGDTPPPPSTAGMEGLRHLIQQAEERRMIIAVENTRRPEYCHLALREIPYASLALCFDTSHAQLWGDGDLLRQHGNRLVATHLSDNDGKADRHWLPGTGVVDWPVVMQSIQAANYHGVLGLEVVATDASEDPYHFLADAYQRGLQLADAIDPRG